MSVFQNCQNPNFSTFRRESLDKMAVVDNTGLGLWEVGEEHECEGAVVCVRYWVALGVLSVAALSMDNLPKIFPGYFLAKGLLMLYAAYSQQPGT